MSVDAAAMSLDQLDRTFYTIEAKEGAVSSVQNTRDKLIDGMRASLRARGFGSTSMKELLADTGVSSGSMYHAFPGGKEALAAATVREVGLHGAQLIADVFLKKRSVAAGLAAIFESLRRDLEQSDFGNGCPIGVPATEAAGVSEAIQEASREVFAAWIVAYRDALIAESWPDADATQLASMIVTAYEGSVTVARATRDTTPIEQAAQHLISFVESHRSPKEQT
jgi:AcrR family transcriptional regulator